jgi:hypothetical protein
MKQNLANRLAGGGFWAIRMGLLSVEVSQRMAEDGIAVPIGNGSAPEVFVTCAVDAFQYFCNANMDGVGRMAVNVQAVTQAATQRYDKYCRPISLEQWSVLVDDLEYRRVGMWSSDGWYVSTIWTGVDPNGCEQPHIFESMVVAMTSEGPRIRHVFRYHNIGEATMGHAQIVHMIRGMGI